MRHRLQADVVDVRVREVVAAARDRDVKLATQMPELRVAPLVRLLLSNDIKSLIAFAIGRVSTSSLSSNPARGLPTTLRALSRADWKRGHVVVRVQLEREVGAVLERQPSQLNVLARRDVQDPNITIRFERIGEQAERVALDDAVWCS